jgi:hypothetical protein
MMNFFYETAMQLKLNPDEILTDDRLVPNDNFSAITVHEMLARPEKEFLEIRNILERHSYKQPNVIIERKFATPRKTISASNLN